MAQDDAHELARPLRPQGFGRTRPTSIGDAIVEPAWPGLRVLASVGGGRATLWEEGEELDDMGGIQAALAGSARSVDGAILDGYLTKQTVTGGIGVKTFAPELPTMSGQISRMFVGGARNRLTELEKRREAEAAAREFQDDDAINLVITDLLWLDGEWLLDVPLLERRRVLDSILRAGALVRPGLFVRHPIDSWVGSWRAQGFYALTIKAANSRYRPGETADDWTLSDLPRR